MTKSIEELRAELAKAEAEDWWAALRVVRIKSEKAELEKDTGARP
tara:strand:- start:35 stop:169 length:135 start_codon:yes stop_codon:yes gene_type:complete